jgi:hypothetical protein
MHVAVLGIGSVVGLDPTGRVVLRRRVHRGSVVKLATRFGLGHRRRVCKSGNDALRTSLRWQ